MGKGWERRIEGSGPGSPRTCPRTLAWKLTFSSWRMMRFARPNAFSSIISDAIIMDKRHRKLKHDSFLMKGNGDW